MAYSDADSGRVGPLCSDMKAASNMVSNGGPRSFDIAAPIGRTGCSGASQCPPIQCANPAANAVSTIGAVTTISTWFSAVGAGNA